MWFYDSGVNDEMWGAVCDSLKTHPTLEVLDLRSASSDATTAEGVITSMVQVLVDMIKVNTSIHSIQVDSHYSEHEIYRESVVPYLPARLLAIQKTRPIGYRTKVLGQALLATRADANRFWMLLAGNAEVAFPPTTTTIAAAANPSTLTTTAATSTSTPANTAATSTAKVATVRASVMSALTTTATGSIPPAAAAAAAATSAAISSTDSASDAFVSTDAADVATPSAGHGQKRKAPPQSCSTQD